MLLQQDSTRAGTHVHVDSPSEVRIVYHVLPLQRICLIESWVMRKFMLGSVASV